MFAAAVNRSPVCLPAHSSFPRCSALPCPFTPAVNNTLFMVVDSCQDCSAGNLVVSSAGLRSLSGGVNVDANPTLQVAWAFESCTPLITGKQAASGAAVEQQRGWGCGAA